MYAERLVIVSEGEVIAEYERLIARGHDRPSRTVYDWRHYLAVVRRKPGALRNGAPFAELPAAFKRLQSALLKRPSGEDGRDLGPRSEAKGGRLILLARWPIREEASSHERIGSRVRHATRM